MIGLTFLATVINYLDRQTLSVVAPTLREEFHMSNSISSGSRNTLKAFTVLTWPKSG